MVIRLKQYSGSDRLGCREPPYNRRVDLDVVFLGTAGSMPTTFRATPALLVRRGGERMLFDCGEGSQRQLLVSSIGLVDLAEIFITHFHADHYLGLPGMLKTFALRGREDPITLYGPPGLRDLHGDLRRIFGRLTYTCNLVELHPGDRLERNGYVLEAFPVLHGVSAIGYALVEEERPGRFDVPTADALGVPAGAERGVLQRGEAVTLADGRVVSPDQVLGPPRRGRKIAITATPHRRRRSSRPFAEPISSSTRRPSSKTSTTAHGRRCTRPRSTPRQRPARPTCRCSRSCTSRVATSAATLHARRGRRSLLRSCRRTSIRSRSGSRSGEVRGW